MILDYSAFNLGTEGWNFKSLSREYLTVGLHDFALLSHDLLEINGYSLGRLAVEVYYYLSSN